MFRFEDIERIKSMNRLSNSIIELTNDNSI